MAIKYLNITVTNKKATFLTRQGDIVCGNSDYRVRFTFDSEWDGHDAKVARFIWGGHFTDVEFSGTEVDVPVISGATEVKVGVYTEGDGPHTTTSATIPATPSVLCEGGTASLENDKRYLNEAREVLEQCEEVLEEIQSGGGASVEVVQTTGESTTAVMSQAAATRSFVNINEDGSASVGAPTSGESAINAYALKRHLSRNSTLYPSKEENGVTVFNKLKFVMPADDKYFAMVGDHSAETGGINPKVSFDTTHPVYIPSVVPTAQYEGYGYSPVPVDLPVNSIRIGAFQQNRTVRSVVIQEGVARIEANAFNGCKQLTSIVLADTIKMIDNNAFNNVGTEVSSAKISVKLPKALEYICQQAFNQVNVCGSIVFPNRCLYIGGIPNNLTSGAGKVFTSPNITQIVFEGTPKYIHSASFEGCTCDIYVPWSEGEVDGAPWGTTGTIHYEYSPTLVDEVYRHDITFEGGLDYNGTTGYVACSVYSRKSEPWDCTNQNCTLTGRTAASGIITIDGTTYTVVGLAKGEGGVSYFIYYVKPDGTVEKFNFYDGTGTFTDTVTQMI